MTNRSLAQQAVNDDILAIQRTVSKLRFHTEAVRTGNLDDLREVGSLLRYDIQAIHDLVDTLVKQDELLKSDVATVASGRNGQTT